MLSARAHGSLLVVLATVSTVLALVQSGVALDASIRAIRAHEAVRTAPCTIESRVAVLAFSPAGAAPACLVTLRTDARPPVRGAAYTATPCAALPNATTCDVWNGDSIQLTLAADYPTPPAPALAIAQFALALALALGGGVLAARLWWRAARAGEPVRAPRGGWFSEAPSDPSGLRVALNTDVV